MKEFNEYAVYRTRLQGGKVVGLITEHSKGLGPEWPLEPQETFYALKPSFRPIPNSMGLALIRVIQSPEFPGNTTNVEYVYDIFDTTKGLYFITWTVPVPHTRPLYLYSGDVGCGPDDHFTENPVNIIPSFEYIKGMKQIVFSPLWVVKKEDFNDKNITFSVDKITGRCLPDPNGQMSLYNCIDTYTNRPIKDLDKASSEGKSIFTSTNNNNNFTIILISVVLISSLISCLIYLVYLCTLKFRSFNK